MRTTLLLAASLLCLAASGCGTTSNEPQGQPETRGSYGTVTGSRLPSATSTVQGVSKEGWEDERRNFPTNPGTIR